MKYLALFTIGPVQTFIAAARKLQDLYAGSYLLSHLSRKTMLEAERCAAVILFPNPRQESAPNRFLMLAEAMDHEGILLFCKKLEAYVREEWIALAKKVFQETKLPYSSAVSAQIEALLQVYYAAEVYQGGEQFSACYLMVMNRLGSAKLLRSFPQLNEPFGRKCNLMHEYNALFYRHKSSYLVEAAHEVGIHNVHALDKCMKQKEALSAVAFVKRCLKYAISDFNDDFPSVSDIYELYGKKINPNDEEDRYYAVVMFDGDNMGNWYAKPEEKGIRPDRMEVFQSYLSEQISQFAAKASHQIVNHKEKKNGVVIYAGGEDFLGAFNLNDVFFALNELRERFGQIDVSDFTGQKLTFSAGIVIAHIKTPLSAVLELVRQVEHEAKEYQDKDNNQEKDAFCLTIARRSGETTKFVQPFYYTGHSSLSTLHQIVELIVKENLSVRFIYQLNEELRRIAETKDRMLHKEIFLIEAKRLLMHARFESQDKRERIVPEVMKLLTELMEHTELDLDSLLKYLRSVAFIAKKRGAAQ